MTEVFVSYKSEDRARVKPLVDALVDAGLSVWWDLGIEGGAGWREAIQSHLDAAACVIVVWSSASVGPDGYFVQDEAAHARRRGVYLPVIVDRTEPPLGFGQEQVLDLIGWRGARDDPRFEDVLAAVRALVASEPRPSPSARDRALRATRRAPWRRTGVVAAGALTLAALLALAVSSSLCPGGRLNCAVLPFAMKSAPPNSIAVLPLANMSGDPSQDYFSDGLSEELISALARLNGLQVIGRTSSFRFKGSKEGAAIIGAKLGVAYLLDGAVRRDGERVRVSAQLAETRTGFERWSETYDRDMKDIFAVQSGIAEAVAEALKVRLMGGDITALSQGGTSDPKAYDAYLRARGLLQTAASEADVRAALAGYDTAIAADPRFARAHAGRATALQTLASDYASGAAVVSTNAAALDSARRAVALAPRVAVVQVVLADSLLAANHDFAAAGRALAEARRYGAGEPNVLIDYGAYRCKIGDCAGAVIALQRATTLDPLEPLAFRWLGRVLMGAHRYRDAAAALQRTLELNPASGEVHAWIGDSLLLLGKPALARIEYAREPLAWARLTGQAIVLRRLGDKAGAAKAFAALSADPDSAYQRAQVYAQWGDLDAALAALDEAIRNGDTGAHELRMDPLMEPLRGDPRFAVRLKRLGLQT